MSRALGKFRGVFGMTDPIGPERVAVAVVTPPDVPSQFMLAVPMYLLFPTTGER